MSDAPLLSVEDLVVTYATGSSLLPHPGRGLHAVAGVSFEIPRGTSLGLVGESGCGKSSVARAIIGLVKARAGRIVYDGTDLAALGVHGRRQYSREIQMIFQDPYSSLNPRLTAHQIIQEGWEIHRDLAPKGNWKTAAAELLERVGLDPAHGDRYPRQFSGGQRQRVGVARALALRPRLLICDEPVSALDVSVQAQVLNLFRDLQHDFQLSYLFISHDLAVVRHTCDAVAVMYLGRIAEIGTAVEIFGNARHPYTTAMLSSAPVTRPWTQPDRTAIVLQGEIPSPSSPPTGCYFNPRCWRAQDTCRDQAPPLDGVPEHRYACYFPVSPARSHADAR